MVYMYHSFLSHLTADGHLGCFHVLAMINSAAMNIGVHVSLSDLVSSVCMPRSGIAGSYGSSIVFCIQNSKHTAKENNKQFINCCYSVTKSCLTPCDPIACSTTGCSVLPEVCSISCALT